MARRAVRVRAKDPTSEADILAGVLKLAPLNLVLMRNSRGKFKNRYGQWFAYGCGKNGTSDILGYRVIRVTQDMVGKRIAQFCALETKRANDDATDDQQAFIDNVNAAGGIGAIAHSVEDAIRALGLS